MILQERIEKYYAAPLESLDRAEARKAFNELKFFLNSGELRAAEQYGSEWKVTPWVKQGILLGFLLGELVDVSINTAFRYFDKDSFPLKKISLDHQVRIVPGGTSVRDGSFIGHNVIIMPPAYVNTGAFIDEGTMIDSHVLVGSCAQIGKRVHVSAGAQIGGVLEPVGALPVIIEDDVTIGGNCGIYDGVIVKRRAVLEAGVVLTGSTPVYDCVNGEVIKKTKDIPLIIPEGAVVVQGSRALASPFALQNQLSIYTPLIIKYRDERTDAATVLEESLR